MTAKLMPNIHRRTFLGGLAASTLAASFSSARAAEATTLRISRAPALAYLPLMVMEAERLIEKATAAKGSPVKAEFVTLAGAAAQTDALLSGSVDIIGTGAAPLITLWEKTKGTSQEVKGLSALGTIPLYLNTRNPAIKSVRDFTDQDRIGMTAAKLSLQAMLLQMAVANEYGPENYAKLDHITVTLAGTEAVAALSSPTHEVNSSFNGGPPWCYAELDIPGVHRVLTMSDILGGTGTTSVLGATTNFVSANPSLVTAFATATEQAIDLILNDKERAVDAYFTTTNDKKSPRSEILRFLNDSETDWSIPPKKMDVYYSFMKKVGTAKVIPNSVAEMFHAKA